MSTFTGKVAVVTGAGSGIGRALALELAGRGAKLALSDVDTAGLDETVRRVEALGAEVKSDFLDVSQRETVLDYAEAVVAHFGKVNQIYNNAGIAYHGDVEKSSFKDIERIVDVDFWGVVNGTKHFCRTSSLRRRPHHQHLQPLRLAGHAVAVRVQRREVRRPRVQRIAAHGDADLEGTGEGDRGAPRWHQDRHRPQRHRRRELRPGRRCEILRRQAGQDHPDRRGQDHPQGRREGQGPGTDRVRRHRARSAAAHHRFAVPGLVAMVSKRAMPRTKK